MRLEMCWWNTKLTPPTGAMINKPVCSQLNKKVEEVINTLFEERPLDLLMLCEVYKRDEALIKKIAEKNEINYIMATDYTSGVYYDFAVLYEPSKIKIKSLDYIDEKNSFEQQLRIGVAIEAEFDEIEVTIFISHWNSDMFFGGIKKSHCAGMLRDKLESLFRKNKELIILAGDYNSQPFDEVIVEDLQTTKDLVVVRKSPRSLYNPFWRNLDSRTSDHSYSGSYFNKQDKQDQWKTFDQMMFSNKFIYGNSWKLDIYSPEIHKEFNNLSFIFTDFFDHIPIYGGLKNEQPK